MFDPVELMMKIENGKFIAYCPPSRDIQFTDGSVAGDLPMQRLSELFNINTFIVSQVNPHIAPFISENKAQVLETFNLRTSFFLLVKTLCGNELKHVTK
jgi:predicted acylesterase/phospholipase RssA